MTDSSFVVDQPAPILAVARAPSFCRLCDVELQGHETWRTHVKSEGHVYKLRLKVSEEPGSGTSPPTPPSGNARQSKSPRPSSRKSRKSEKKRQRDETNVDVDQEQDQDITSGSEGDSEHEPSAPNFDSSICLFCVQDSSTWDDNLKHMSTSHGFSVPFQEFLAVDLETVLAYLHFVIYAYQECISCGARRNTVEGIQQHMVAKGHCRFDLNPDTEEFYEMPQTENVVLDQAQRHANTSVRLPSGKLISHRKNLEIQDPRRAIRRATSDQHPPLEPDAGPSSELVSQRREQGGTGSGEMVRSNEAIFAAQMSRLKIAGDRAQQKAEQRKRGRLERATNSIMMKRFQMDSSDGRFDPRF